MKEPDSAQDVTPLISGIPEGWSKVQVDRGSWAVTRTTRAGGKAITFDAERLHDGHRLSANIWLAGTGAVLRPCEVPENEVMHVMRAAACALADAAPDRNHDPAA